MKQKKVIISAICFLLCFMSIAATNRDCFWEFHLDVVAAQSTYQNDLDYCAEQMIEVKCLMEADASYQNSLSVALDDFDDCIG